MTSKSNLQAELIKKLFCYNIFIANWKTNSLANMIAKKIIDYLHVAQPTI